MRIEKSRVKIAANKSDSWVWPIVAIEPRRWRSFILVFRFFLTSLFRNLRVRCERECARLSLLNGKRTPSIMFLYFLFYKLFNVGLDSNNNFKQPFLCSLFFALAFLCRQIGKRYVWLLFICFLFYCVTCHLLHTTRCHSNWKVKILYWIRFALRLWGNRRMKAKDDAMDERWIVDGDAD